MISARRAAVLAYGPRDLASVTAHVLSRPVVTTWSALGGRSECLQREPGRQEDLISDDQSGHALVTKLNRALPVLVAAPYLPSENQPSGKSCWLGRGFGESCGGGLMLPAARTPFPL